MQPALIALFQPANAGDDLLDEDLVQQLGAYYYTFDEGWVDLIGRYSRHIVPARPLHVDQLPPLLREQFHAITCHRVDFRSAEFVQPSEFAECVYWEEDCTAFLCQDGVTVQPIPGKEDGFADYVRWFREEYPNAAADFVFDGPTDVSSEQEDD